MPKVQISGSHKGQQQCQCRRTAQRPDFNPGRSAKNIREHVAERAECSQREHDDNLMGRKPSQVAGIDPM
ncbi:MAG: hypothetical protein ACK511_07380, partial [Burkholderiales bacterium]